MVSIFTIDFDKIDPTIFIFFTLLGTITYSQCINSVLMIAISAIIDFDKIAPAIYFFAFLTLLGTITYVSIY